MSNLRVNNVNIGDTSVDGVIQQVDSQGTPNTAGNKITLKTDGTNTVDGETTFNSETIFNSETTFNNSTVTKYIGYEFATSNFNASTNLGKVVNFQGTYTVTVDDLTSTTAGGILTLINTGTGTITISQGTNVTMIYVGTGLRSSLSLAQYGMCTIYAIKVSGQNTYAYVSGVGLS